MTKTATITAERVRDVLDYDHESGSLRWKVRVARSVHIGDIAGTINKGYRRIAIDGVVHNAHRLVWLHVYGVHPKQEIDHIDGDKLNNRVANLRDVGRAVNAQNLRRPLKHAAVGLLGVSPSGAKFTARVQIDGRQVYLGTFDTPDCAHAAYVAAKRVAQPGCTI